MTAASLVSLSLALLWGGFALTWLLRRKAARRTALPPLLSAGLLLAPHVISKPGGTNGPPARGSAPLLGHGPTDTGELLWTGNSRTAATAAVSVPLADWASFDAWAANARDCARFVGALHPPGLTRFGESLGIVPFDPTALPALLVLPDEPLLDPIRARRVFLEESLDSAPSREWIVRAADGTVVRTLAPPAGYDPLTWIEDEYGNPPLWLAGNALADWYAARDPARIVPFALLVTETDFSDYHAALAAAATTNEPVLAGFPCAPAVSNAPVFVAFSMITNGVPSGWLWSPWPDRAHTVFRKEMLNDPLWDPAFGLVPGNALSVWADAVPDSTAPSLRSASAESGFYVAAEVETDSDGDGLPDGMEMLAHGSSPFLSDSDGDGLSDADEIGRYGTSPVLADTNGDGIPDGLAIRKRLDPVSGDTDGDGLSDTDELFLCMTDPCKADTDEDGLSDYDEVVIHGTSPFETDTDDDKLSDRKEVEECGTSPLLRDSDADGMDDYYEWTARTLGFDPADSSDGLLDRDGDGIPNAEEYAWGWSNFTRASSNAIPRTKLFSSQAGEDPVFRSGVWQVLAFGRNGAAGTRIRIPKSVQLGTNTIARTLHWTAAPGIRLGDTPLDVAGSLFIPDENVELAVWAAPSAGGAESTLRLIDATGNTNGTLRVRVPFLTGADLYLSSAQTPTPYHTNLVSGITNVVCAPADDPVYEKPRAYLNPNYPSVLDLDHRLLERTDFLLARISGATPEATLPVNAIRWDGAWGVSDLPRRGFELEPGVSRIEAGIDFSLDGVLDPDEIEVFCDVFVVPVRLCADTDRDGEVTPADRPSRNRWTPSRGALLAPDGAPVSADLCRPVDDRPLSRLTVRSTGVPLPDGWSMRLSTSAGSSLRLYREGEPGWFSVSPWTTNGLENLATMDADLLLSDAQPDGATASETKVTLSLRHGNRTLGTDSVTLRHAPLIVPWNTLPLKRLYTAGVPGGLRFPSEVEPAKQRCFPSRGVQWVQDLMQMTVLQLDDNAGGTPVAIDLERAGENEFVDLLPAGVGVAYGEFLGYVWLINHGDGGNIEATPPLPGWPFGRLLTGVGKDGGTRPCAAVRMLEDQGLQGPAITVPVGWLAVGHVDEVCCFVDDRTVLVPSPRLAFDLIAEQVRLHHGNYTDTFVWGLDTNNYFHCMQDVLFKPVRTNDVLQTDISSEAATLTLAGDMFLDTGYLLCEDEIMNVLAVSQNEGNTIAIVSRGEFGTIPQFHAAGAEFFRLTSIAAKNIDVSEGGILSQLADIRGRLVSAVPNLQFVFCPVLYDERDSGFVAGTVNMVNALVSGNTVYMTDPGCALFRNAVQLPGKRFIGGLNAWELYHCLMGELHCGSEAEREIPPNRPFWKEREFRVWPHERKGTTQ